MVLNSQASLERARFRNNRMAGIANWTSDLLAKDLMLEDTNGQLSNGSFGHGLSLLYGATADVENVLIRGNRSAGLVMGGEQTKLTASQVEIAGSQMSDCLAQELGFCDPGLVGHGLLQLGGSTVLEDF